MKPSATSTTTPAPKTSARATPRRARRQAAPTEAPQQDATPPRPASAPRKRPAATVPASPALASSATKAGAAPQTAKPRKAEKAEKVEKADKPKKPKMVRDSLTMPKAEYAVIDTMKLRAAKAGHPAKKTEVIRAALKVLAALPDTAFLAAMQAVPSIKTGRPAKGD